MQDWDTALDDLNRLKDVIDAGVSTFNKKFLLHEHKRHNARCVASTRCAALFGKGGGTTYPGWGRGYLPWMMGTYLGLGTTTLAMGYLPRMGGTPPIPPPNQLESTNLPPPRTDRQMRVKTLPSPLLRMQVVIKIIDRGRLVYYQTHLFEGTQVMRVFVILECFYFNYRHSHHYKLFNKEPG